MVEELETESDAGVKFLLKSGLGQTAIREIGNHLRAYGTGHHWIERYRGDVFIHTIHDKDTQILIRNFSHFVDPVRNGTSEQR